jgi:DnaK suppressor protein
MHTRQIESKKAGRSVIHSQDETKRRLLAERRDVIDAFALNPLSGSDVGERGQQSDYASIDQLRDVEYSHREALSRRLHQLDEALERIRLGLYGLCTECGALIVDKRLTLDPAAGLCVGCQTAFESATL